MIESPCLYNISSSGDFVLLINFRIAMDSSAAMSLYTFNVTNVVSEVSLEQNIQNNATHVS